MVEHLGLTNVEFAGHQNNIEEIWRKHHALVLPSRFEGMPLVVVEAMLCGRPCIATDVGGNRELVRDGINGFLAKAPTVELLDEAMNRAWDNRGRLRKWAVPPRRMFANGFPVIQAKILHWSWKELRWKQRPKLSRDERTGLRYHWTPG